ncbi:hypothetical protein KV112_06355 [Mycolicibacter sp. MYC123]|uniref:Uncharacterized protein n=1 Tax=[Mycobacterium] zoologicum TaxID=2872311 RepID=A0ABU5YH24_9MYCO|nr:MULTISPECIES: hypothetical protein [unclassified Mycolicibacter]MEB3049366.1 hypothetical protein [Mycolicibacter sp. MYC123]MEB3062672.1 hypothetical protein [Mycolicibacter sp. MYC101]
MAPTLASLGFALDEVMSGIVYAERPAWAAFYRGPDCKLQICWSSREGGMEFMLAPLDAPNQFGLEDGFKTWRFMLGLSDVTDDLGPPPIYGSLDEIWAWQKAKFQAHFEAAKRALLAG